MADSLGRQILGASFDHVSDALAQAEARAAGEWTEGHAQAVEEDRARLRALAARATAAERGMVAMGALVDELQAAFNREMSSIRRTTYTGAGHTVELARATESLAAWRALGEVGG